MRFVKLSEISSINPRKPSGLKSELPCSFVPMEYVDDVTGSVAQMDIRPIGDVEKGYSFFQESDVLFAKITPCMENGKCAIARNLVNQIGFGSTEFHVLRAQKETIPEWIYEALPVESNESLSGVLLFSDSAPPAFFSLLLRREKRMTKKSTISIMRSIIIHSLQR